MRRGDHHGFTQRARPGEPQPAPLQTPGDEPIANKRDLKTWWKNFSRGNQKRDEEKVAHQQGIFGIPLQTSVRYANVAISLQDADGRSYVYGYVPIVVAKCGVFLKEKATDVEGIFRLSGSEKRIKELKEAFNSPDRYGKGLDWTGYTVHDAANILRRYFNQLPEPIIPLEFYERFRDPLRGHQSQAVGQIEGQSPAEGDFDHQTTIRIYQSLITELPPLNRQLLLYILDLLAVFASKSDFNKMTTPNLAAIFQPGILSHPSHDMAPPEYRLSQDVLIFLIENQDHFLIGMSGTGVDEKTKQDVESGPPTPSAQRPPKTLLGRSSSGASKYSSGVRRSVSVSSRQSGSVVAPSPISPGAHTPTSSGVHRSNTVPSKHSPRASSARFQKEQTTSEGPSPAITPMYTPAEMPGAFPNIGEEPAESSAPPAVTGIPLPAAPEIQPPSSEEATPQVQSPQTGSLGSATQLIPSDKNRPEAIDIPATARNVSGGSDQLTPGGSRLAAFFAPSKPGAPSGEARKPNKLQKKRGPGSANPSAQSSSQSLNDAPNDFDQAATATTATASTTTGSSVAATSGTGATSTVGGASSIQPTPTTATFLQPPSQDSTPLKPPPPIGGAGAVPTSPAHSYRSHSEFTEGELDDVQPLDHQGIADVMSDKEGEAGGVKKEKRRFWRRKGDSVSYSHGSQASHSPSPNFEAQRSRSSVLSGGDGNRKSLNLDRNATLSDPESGDLQRDSNPLLWIKGKLAESREKKEEKDRLRQEAKEERKRAKSPPPPGISAEHSRMQSLGAATHAATGATGVQHAGFEGGAGAALKSPPMADVPPRGKSLDFRREKSPAAAEAAPKQSMDVPSSTSSMGPPSAPASASLAAASTAMPAQPASTTSSGESGRKQSLLEIGEQDAKTAAQLAAESSNNHEAAATTTDVKDHAADKSA